MKTLIIKSIPLFLFNSLWNNFNSNFNWSHHVCYAILYWTNSINNVLKHIWFNTLFLHLVLAHHRFPWSTHLQSRRNVTLIRWTLPFSCMLECQLVTLLFWSHERSIRLTHHFFLHDLIKLFRFVLMLRSFIAHHCIWSLL